MSIEIKEAIEPEGGHFNINAMKSEIHRMTMRHSALMREQERLVRAMESSVTR